MAPAVQMEHSTERGASYARAWRKYAVRHHLALLLLWSWLPVCVGLPVLSQRLTRQPELCIAVMGVWLAAALAAVWWAGEFRCPRCSRRYAALGHRRYKLTRGLFEKICSNCKLAKFER